MMKVKAKHWKLPSIKWGSFELLQKQHIAGDHHPCGVLMDRNNSPRQSVSHSSVHNKLKGACNKETYGIFKLHVVCVCVCTHTRVCVYAWVYVWRPEINLVCHSLDVIHSPCFLRKVLSLGFRARIPLLWLAGTTITNTHLYIWPFKWVPGFNLRVSCLHDSHFTDRVSSSALAPKCWCILKSSMNPVRKNLVSQKFSFKQLFTTFSMTRV